MGGAVGDVLRLAGGKPCGVGDGGRGRAGWKLVARGFRLPLGLGRRCCMVGQGQQDAVKALLADGIGKVSLMGAGDEGNTVVVLAQLVGKGKAAHDVSAADLQRCVCADKELHGKPFGEQFETKFCEIRIALAVFR